MNQLRSGLDRTLGGLLALLVGAAVVNVVWQVFSRFALQSPSSFTDELARFLLVWMGLVGAAYAAGRRLHVAVDLWPSSLGPGVRRALDVSADLAILAFAVGVMIVGGTRLVMLSFELGQRSAALGLPLGVVYLALPLSGVSIALYSLLSLSGALPGGAAHEERP